MSRMYRSHLLRPIAAAVTVMVGMIGTVVVSGLTTSTQAAAAVAPQHYLCYTAAAKQGFTPPTSGVTLINSLAPSGFSPIIGSANVHCNPAVKVVPGAKFAITNPTWHFLGFRITAQGQPSATVAVTNQFGNANLITSSPTELLVPSWKSLTGLPNEPTPQPVGEDHYTCYPVKYATGSTLFKPPASVKVKDEFGPLTKVTIGAPQVLCVPTEKILPTGQVFPINDPSTNYVCFQVSKTPIKSPVFDQNQFGQAPVIIKATKWLCLPSTLGGTGTS